MLKAGFFSACDLQSKAAMMTAGSKCRLEMFNSWILVFEWLFELEMFGGRKTTSDA